MKEAYWSWRLLSNRVLKYTFIPLIKKICWARNIKRTLWAKKGCAFINEYVNNIKCITSWALRPMGIQWESIWINNRINGLHMAYNGIGMEMNLVKHYFYIAMASNLL